MLNAYNVSCTHFCDRIIKNISLMKNASFCILSPINIHAKYCHLIIILQSTRSPRDSLKYFVISYLHMSDLQIEGKKINRTTTFYKWIYNLTPEIRDFLKNVVEKRRNCNFSSFPQYFVTCCLFVLTFYGPVNPIGSYQAQSVYLNTRLLGRLSPLSG